MYFIVFNPILIVSQDGICIRIVNVACKNKTPVFSLVDVTCVDISLTDDVTTFHGNADISSLVDVTNIDDIIVNVAVNDSTDIHIFGDATIIIIAVTCINADDASIVVSQSGTTTIIIIDVACIMDSLFP
mgnify:CR=1 FL=1|tara:strand:+ start:212 stop:601 length:390 start_codon:yes stop_codon:yes gene_type:complete